MCGISGIVSKNRPTDLDDLLQLQNSLAHRGPDASSHFCNGPVGLSHNRLSIIDIDTANQPFFDQDKSLCLIANGEIYNFSDIRKHYQKNGYSFSSRNSDCEVIVPLYLEHGINCLEKLRGMFAFAIWDANCQKLILARDRMGEKPLYFYHSQDNFVFSSELRSIASSRLVDTTVSHKQIARYFRYKYVPEPFTPFEQIQKLPAGSYLELDVTSWTYEIKRYWSAWQAKPNAGSPVEAIRHSLEDAIRTCIVSDVPMGLSLSGGIDSSILACMLSEYSSKPLQIFSVGYPGAPEVDERAQAKQLADRLAQPFHEIEITNDYVVETFEDLIFSRNDPISDISGFSYLAIMRKAHELGVKVMFQGHGLDELCWGYQWVKDVVQINEGRWYKKGDRNGFRELRKRAVSELKGYFKRNLLRDKRLYMFEHTAGTQFVDENFLEIFRPEFIENSAWIASDPIAEYGEASNRNDLDITRLIIDYYLLENGIAQGDRISMASSIEMRLPFVDYKLVETIIGLRKSARDDQLPPKHYLKESVRDLLGDEIINRPKRGFEPPVHVWYNSLINSHKEIFGGGYLEDQKIVRGDFLQRANKPESLSKREREVAWDALNLEMWFRSLECSNRIGADRKHIVA